MRTALLLWLCAVAAATDRIVMTMGKLSSSLIASIEALPSVQGSIYYTDFAGLIRVEGDEQPVTQLLDAAHIHYEVEMQKQYTPVVVEWNLDRIDQRNLPLDGSAFNPVSGASGLGNGVDIYIVDAGMNINHEEFQWPDNAAINRATSDYFVSAASDDIPCSFHGTGVASVAGGKTLGVARKANLHSVKVSSVSNPNADPSNCAITLDSLLEGLLWIIANGTTPSVINLSLAGGRSVCVDLLVKKLSMDGNFVADAAGNNGLLDKACDLSPARSAYSITTGYTDIIGNQDTRATASNYGDCVDFFAPGQDVRVALANGNTAYGMSSGSSFASPLVAGAAALIKSHLDLLALPSSFEDVLADLRDRGVTNNVNGAGPTTYYFLHVGADAGILRPSVALLALLSMV